MSYDPHHQTPSGPRRSFPLWARIVALVTAIAMVLLTLASLFSWFPFTSASSTQSPTPTQSVAAAASSSNASVSAAEKPRAERIDDSYVSDAQPYHQLDLFLPDDAAHPPYPLVIFVHGGGWRLGDKSAWSSGQDEMQPVKTKEVLMRNGFATASINYRLYTAQTPSYPGNVHDVKAAIRYLRANAAALGVDPNRFAIFGESAGGHLAQLMGTSADVSQLDGTLGNAGVSSAVQAVVSYYGFSDLAARTQQQLAQGCTPDTKGFTSQGRMLGAEPDTTAKGKALAAQASAITYVDPKDPPMLLVHGRQDCTSPLAQDTAMIKALEAQGVPVQSTVIDAGHAESKFYTDATIQQNLVSFLKSSLEVS